MKRGAQANADPAGAVEALAAHPDVTRLRGHAGQVVIYPRHTPAGVFVVLKGTLKRLHQGDGGRSRPSAVLDARRRAMVVPALDELDLPAGSGVALASESELLFVPRSLALGEPDVRRHLGGLAFAAVSLK